jgi:prepilin-type N-terminal cleavage/methylation domain-containing protein
MRKKQAGFSLIELLIVVAIILIIAAIAIPNFMSSRMSANEASSASSVRSISTAETAYATAYPSIGYSVALLDLGDGGSSNCVAISTRACLIDSILAGGTKSGYLFTYANDGNTPAVGYTINADPAVRGSSGRRSFFSNQPGEIRYNNAAAATITDPVI